MLRSIRITVVLCLLLSTVSSAQNSDREYRIQMLQETQTNGTILRQQPLQGSVTLHADGTYTLQGTSPDQGMWRLEPAEAPQPAKVLFTSNSGVTYFAWQRGDKLSIWLRQTENGTHLWAVAQLQQSAGSPAGALPEGSTFSRGVMFGSSNTLAYQYADPGTGQILGSDSAGFVFHPDGTFGMRMVQAGQEQQFSGRYRIENGLIHMSFDAGGDPMTLTIGEQGSVLYWYDGGELVTQYQFLGFVQ